jgi:hypothetical protein
MESRRENVKDKSKENCKYIKKAYVLWKWIYTYMLIYKHKKIMYIYIKCHEKKK